MKTSRSKHYNSSRSSLPFEDGMTNVKFLNVVDDSPEYHGDRYLSHILVAVYTHPLLTEDADGNLYLPHQRFLGYENYWFITPDDPKIDRLEEDYYAGRIL